MTARDTGIGDVSSTVSRTAAVSSHSHARRHTAIAPSSREVLHSGMHAPARASGGGHVPPRASGHARTVAVTPPPPGRRATQFEETSAAAPPAATPPLCTLPHLLFSSLSLCLCLSLSLSLSLSLFSPPLLSPLLCASLSVSLSSLPSSSLSSSLSPSLSSPLLIASHVRVLFVTPLSFSSPQSSSLHPLLLSISLSLSLSLSTAANVRDRRRKASTTRKDEKSHTIPDESGRSRATRTVSTTSTSSSFAGRVRSHLKLSHLLPLRRSRRRSVSNASHKGAPSRALHYKMSTEWDADKLFLPMVPW